MNTLNIWYDIKLARLGEGAVKNAQTLTKTQDTDSSELVVNIEFEMRMEKSVHAITKMMKHTKRCTLYTRCSQVQRDKKKK